MAILYSRHQMLGAGASRVAALPARLGDGAAFCLAGAAWRSRQPRASPHPTIQAKLLDGTAFNLADDAGKVVIVNMWATWCAPCREEMPALDAYYRAAS